MTSRLVLLGALLAGAAWTQTITQPNPLVPANLKPQATKGDLTRCVITPWGSSTRNLHVDCKIGTRVTQTISAVMNTTWIEAGADMMIELNFDPKNSKLVHYWAVANTRDSTGGVTATTLIAQADITWP